MAVCMGLGRWQEQVKRENLLETSQQALMCVSVCYRDMTYLLG